MVPKLKLLPRKRTVNKPYEIEPKDKQVKAVNNLLSGKFKTQSAALEDAGYSPKTPTTEVLHYRGVQVYLKRLGKSFKERYGKELPDQVIEGYADGLRATKLYGKDGIEMPDWTARKQYLDAFAEFFGWKHQAIAQGAKIQQNNFFSVPKNEQSKFNDDFKEFIRKFYG